MGRIEKTQKQIIKKLDSQDSAIEILAKKMDKGLSSLHRSQEKLKGKLEELTVEVQAAQQEDEGEEPDSQSPTI